MQNTTFDPARTLTERLASMSPEEIVKMGRELCAALEKDGSSCRGGIWPGNVSFDEDGKAVPGPGSEAPIASLSADEIEYLAPEVFWDNLRSPAADVYSTGMLLYVAANGGRLPFVSDDDGELERAKALRRRMKGEALPMPEGLSEELSAILTKALAYEPQARYADPSSLLHALSETHEALPSQAPESGSETMEDVAAAISSRILMEEADDRTGAQSLPVEEPAAEEPKKKQYTVRKDVESPASRRATEKKKRRGPLLVLLAGAVVVLALIIAAVAALGRLGGDPQTLSPTLPPAPTATPEPTEEPTPTATPEPTATPNPIVYTAFATEDSWTELSTAELDGGAGLVLATAKDDAEFDAAVTAARSKYLKNLWLGAEYLDEDEAPNGQAGWYWNDGTPLADDDPRWADGQSTEEPEGKKLMLRCVSAEDSEDSAVEDWRFYAVADEDTGDYEDLGYVLKGRVSATPRPDASPMPTVTPRPATQTTSQPRVTPNYEYTPERTPVPTKAPTPVPTKEPTATPVPTAEPTATPEPTAEPTATPEPTAEPTATPEPTTEPTATPEPTTEPTPTAEPTPTPVVPNYSISATDKSWSELTAPADPEDTVTLASAKTTEERAALIVKAQASGLKNLWLGAEYRPDSDPSDGTDDSGWYWTEDDSKLDEAFPWENGTPDPDPEGKKLMLCLVEDTGTDPVTTKWVFRAVADDASGLTDLGYITADAVTSSTDGPDVVNDGLALFDESLLKPIPTH